MPYFSLVLLCEIKSQIKSEQHSASVNSNITLKTVFEGNYKVKFFKKVIISISSIISLILLITFIIVITQNDYDVTSFFKYSPC